VDSTEAAVRKRAYRALKYVKACVQKARRK